jgi:cytosine/uracil/thiamine/allantoin permease
MKNKYGTISVISAALALPFALMVGNVASLLLKSSNPNNIDITASLAYLSQTMTAAVVAFVALTLVSLLTAVLGMKQANKETAKMGLKILVAVVLISVFAAILQKRTERVETDYSKQQINSLYEVLKKD